LKQLIGGVFIDIPH